MDTDSDYYEIRQRENRVELFPGAMTTVWGYEGLFPVRRSKPGETGVWWYGTRTSSRITPSPTSTEA